MKIAIAGKGGVGKTTISGTICRVLAKEGERVLAIDGDPNPNLSVVLGIDKDQPPQRSLSTDIIERVEEGESWSFRVKRAAGSRRCNIADSWQTRASWYWLYVWISHSCQRAHPLRIDL